MKVPDSSDRVLTPLERSRWREIEAQLHPQSLRPPPCGIRAALNYALICQYTGHVAAFQFQSSSTRLGTQLENNSGTPSGQPRPRQGRPAPELAVSRRRTGEFIKRPDECCALYIKTLLLPTLNGREEFVQY